MKISRKHDIINLPINKNFARYIMKKSFICSLICPNGIIGGGIDMDNTSVTYKTNKLTVNQKYKNLVLPLHEICDLTWKWIVFPIATVQMRSGERYRFIIFSKGRFSKYFDEVKNPPSSD